MTFVDGARNETTALDAVHQCRKSFEPPCTCSVRMKDCIAEQMADCSSTLWAHAKLHIPSAVSKHLLASSSLEARCFFLTHHGYMTLRIV